MICLDTNYLIGALVPGSLEGEALINWVQSGEGLIAPAIVWYEFRCGPVTPAQVRTMKAFLKEIAPFDEAQANQASALFNKIGRKRNLRVDTMIAATAIIQNAPLATHNRSDFEIFVPFGLKLVS